MPCFHPLKGYYARKSNPKTGKRSVVFNMGEGFHDFRVELPCGRCIGCRLERSRQWAARCVHEAQIHPQNSFITLTFREACPLDGEKIDPTVSLHKYHFQRFLKRLRKQFVPKEPKFATSEEKKKWQHENQIRYYHCGEYGDESARPHHHAILFNFDFPDKKYKTTKCGNNYYTSRILQDLWPWGHSIIGNATFESAAYVARYCTKKINGPLAKDHYKGRTPEYSTMSRRPGIGAGWLSKYKTDVFPNDFIVVRGKTCKVPKYYNKTFELTNPELYGTVKVSRIQSARDNPVHYRRLEDAETIQTAKAGLLKTTI